jgi:hypothetical protein
MTQFEWWLWCKLYANWLRLQACWHRLMVAKCRVNMAWHSWLASLVEGGGRVGTAAMLFLLARSGNPGEFRLMVASLTARRLPWVTKPPLRHPAAQKLAYQMIEDVRTNPKAAADPEVQADHGRADCEGHHI